MRSNYVEFQTVDGVTTVRPFGNACFLNSGEVKEYSKAEIAAGIRRFLVDLTHCAATFVGTLAGMALRLRELGGGTVVVFNCPPQPLKLITSLGLDELLEIRRPRGKL